MTKETQVPKAEVPLRPSRDASRIASSLVRSPFSLSSARDAPRRYCNEDAGLLEAVQAAIRARSLRPEHVPSELLLDPAWDMLLELLRAEISSDQATASTLSKAAGVTTSSALRWIDALVAKGLCIRGDRAQDGRMSVALSPRGSNELRAYFASIIRPLSP